MKFVHSPIETSTFNDSIKHYQIFHMHSILSKGPVYWAKAGK